MKLGQIIKFFIIFNSLLISFTTNLWAKKVYSSITISTDTTWDGEIIVAGRLIFDRKATLTIKPGTKIFFKKVDEDNDGLSESTIIVNGNIIANGTKDRPIYFTSLEEKKEWGDWKEIQINHAKGFVFNNCVVEYAEFGLHIHFSEGIIKNSIFRNNGDATRLGNSVLTFVNNLFENNVGKALNFTNCRIQFRENTIRNNREGVFVFEKTGETLIESNNFYDNKIDVTTGDFFQGTLRIGKNFFSDTSKIKAGIVFERAEKPFFAILPECYNNFIHKVINTDGFVDGSANSAEKKVFFTSFDGKFYSYSLSDDKLESLFLGEFLDCKPLIVENYAIVVDWSGNVISIDFRNMKKKWETKLKSSLKDDHRMPSPVFFKGNIVVARPDGNIYFLDWQSGNIIKNFSIDDEFRATPYVWKDRLYFSGCNGTIVFVEGSEIIGKIKLEASFYSSPVEYLDTLVIVDKTGKLFFLDRDLKIKKTLFLDSYFRYQSPVVKEGRLYLFSLKGEIFEIFDDIVNRENRFDVIFTSTPVVIDNYLVVPTFCGKLLFYSKSKKFFVGNFGEIQFEPHYAYGLIFVGTRDNKLYVLKMW